MRTHDERFAGLPGFAFAPHYLEWRGLRAHYLDEGQGDENVPVACTATRPGATFTGA